MAGLSGAWGSREELLHPRDSHGRFRSKWKMAEGVVDAISNFLDRFNPRTFQSDNQASQYLFNRAKPDRFGGGAGYPRLHADFDETNAHLRAGEIDAPTQKFIKMMDDSAITTQDQLIISRTMGADSFGLTPETLAQQDGGIEDFTARLIGERGYTAGVIGTPMGHGPGKVTMSIAVPKGTKLIIPARSQTDRGVFFDKDQEFRVTKVTPDGRGGYYMMAIATPRTPGQTPEPIDNGPRGVGLTPAQREAGVLRGQQITGKREKRLEAPPPAGQTPVTPYHAPSPTGPTDTGPGGPPPRNEPIHAPSIGAGTPAPSEVTPGQASAPQPPSTPETPAAPTPDFRAAVRDAQLQWPSEGARRKQFNNAYLGLVNGKQHPEDTLRQLEADIRTNKDSLSRFKGEPQAIGNRHREGDIANLDGDIKKQEQLADLIAKQYGLQRAQEPAAPAAVKKAVTPGATPITQAPGEKHRQIPGEVGNRPVTNLEARRAQKATQAPRPPQREEPTPPPAPQKQAPLAKVIPIKATPGAPSTTHEAPVKAAPEPEKPTVSAARVKKGDVLLVRKNDQGEWDLTKTKTGATPITVTGKKVGNGRHAITGTDPNGNEITTRPIPGQNVLLRHKEKAPAVKAVKEAAPKVAAAPRLQGFGPKKGPDVVRGKTRATALKPGDHIMVDTDSEGNVLPEMVSGKGRPATVDKVNSDGSLDITEADGKKVTTKGQENAPGAQMPYYRKATATETRRATKAAAPTPTKKAAPATSEAPAASKTSKQLEAEANRLVGTRGNQKEVARLRAESNLQAIKERGGEPNLDQMTKAELIAHAGQQGVTARQSWTKDKIKEAIRSHESLTKSLQIQSRGGFREEAAPEPDLIANLAKEVGIKGDGGGVIPARQLDLKQGLSEQEVADKIARDADQLEASPMPAPGSDKTITKDMQDRRDESVRQLRELATRLRTRNGPPAEPNAPAAQKPIQAPDRREAFAEAWANDSKLVRPPTGVETAAHRSAVEVRDDVLSGKITPDEGIRRLENDIDLNKQELADVEREMRGRVTPEEFSRLVTDRDKLRAGISYQENASSLMRQHFRKAPVITPKEVEVQLDPEAKNLIDSAGPNDIREAAKVGGFGDLKGDTKDELLQDLVKKIAGKELASRAAKKAAPKKLAPAPLVTKKSSDPDYVDARAIAEGLNMNSEDTNMLSYVQELLDGTSTKRAMTPAAVGRELRKFAEGPAGPGYKAAVITGVSGRDGQLSPEHQAEHDQLVQQLDRWRNLADRLEKTRRRPARKATEPAPEKPTLTPEEKKVTAQAAEVLGVPKEQLQSRALAKKVAAAPPHEAAKSAVEQMRTMQSREEGQAFLKNRTKAELQEIAKASNMPYQSKDTKAQLVDNLVQFNIGARLDTEAIHKLRPFDRPITQNNLDLMTPAQLATLESQLGIKRVSLDRGDRIAAIRKAQEGANTPSFAKSLPDSGRKWNWQTIQEDNMVMHGDSASMNLAQKLHKAGREDQAQYVADMRYRISNPRGEHSPDDVEKMVKDLNTMMDAEQDPAIKALYRRALNDIAAPETAAPKLPESTPPALHKMMDELNQIPVARRSGHFAGTSKDVSAVDRLAELIRKVDSGDGGSIGTVESEIRRILHSLHESVDGAMAMWRLESLIDDPGIKAWIRSFY